MEGQEEYSVSDTVFKILKKFVVKSIGWVTIYALGYFEFSVAWLITPLMLTVLRAQWKSDRKHKLSAAREAALTDEKQMIESRIRVEDLPSWVFFPDKERAEWINSIIQQLWPNVGKYTRNLIDTTIEPAVKTALDGYGMKGFKFEKVVLGRVPPRITGVKVYEKNIARDEIIMDLDLVFASDCDIKFSLKKITAKINDFSLRGVVRVVLKPLITEIPLIGGIQVYFLTPPEIDFDLGGVANALDAPDKELQTFSEIVAANLSHIEQLHSCNTPLWLRYIMNWPLIKSLSGIIRRIVLEQIGYFMVLPHKFSMAMTESVSTSELKCPDSAGVLRVNLIRAIDLMKKDIGVLGLGKSDPYATLVVGAKTVQTKTKPNTITPEWYFTADFPIEVVKGQLLTIEVFDHDDPGDDEFLGRATVSTSVVEERGHIEKMWTELEDVKSGKVQLSLSWLEATTDKSVLQDYHDEDEAKCLLHVYIDSCHNLQSPATKYKESSKPSPFVELNIGNNVESQKTYPESFTNDPVFEKGFTFTVINPYSDDLHIRVIDSGHKDTEIGSIKIRTSDIMEAPNMEYNQQSFTLKGISNNGEIKLAANVRCLKKAEKKNKKLSDAIQKKPSQTEFKKESVKPAEVPNVHQKLSETKSMEPPSLEEMVGATIEPMIETTGNQVDMDEFLNPPEPETELRHRTNVQSVSSGKIKLSLTYEKKSGSLQVHVHEAKGLPGGDLPDPPDPYVKLYLLPERSKKSKRKSDAKKDTVTPVFEETFDYDVEVLKMNSELEVSVVDRKGIFSRRSTMGQVVIKLDDVISGDILNQWFDLLEVDEDSD